ncbi:photosynthetic reaction center cytochrome PufC [Hydrogenophaga flava]|uniref:photosynthetic reaction center cytochrome PufC n=1 Tax=Hydrogenophaga flava TaxID=65657 RepID=UPI000A05C36C|nr:photosynthetic reaction center cytochrome PufC [Hydrogenophaga flava]
MNTRHTAHAGWLKLLALGSLVLLTACERPPMDTVQNGYRGTGMVQVYNPRTMEGVIEANQPPPPAPAPAPDGPKASEVYQNVKVLGHLSVGDFTNLMVSMTAWVAPPEQGCNYCHNPANFADDSLYTKLVARNMVKMTQTINSDWKNHVSTTGVTCFTCHRGQPVPKFVWFKPPVQDKGADFIGNKMAQNTPASSVKLASLPYDPFTPYLSGSKPIRVQSTKALPTDHVASIARTETTYSLMTHMSASLGVNCTFCHSTQSFSKWDGGPPQRLTAFHGIRMVRDLNNQHMEPLTPTFPANRKGELGDVAKLNCATCHQGAYKPLFGAPMVKDYPGLAALREAVEKTAAIPAAPADGVPAAGDAPAVATAAAAAPSEALAALLPAKVLFTVGKDNLTDEARKVIADAAKLLAAEPGVKVTISGFADQSGNMDANMELSKRRAFSVRDALKAAGVAEDRIELRKPELAVAGASADARRVEINAAR